MYDSIVLPTDGSDLAERAFDHALDLTKTYDAELHVVYAVDVPDAAEFDVAAVAQQLQASGESATRQLADRAETAGVDASAAVVHGLPYRAILDYADDADADLVVMATHGRSGLDRYLIGSVTEKVVRLSDVPVLTVRAGDSEK